MPATTRRRPTSPPTVLGPRRAESSPTSPSQSSPVPKRQRNDDETDHRDEQSCRAETVVIDSLGEVPAALKLVQAMKKCSALGAIGYCPPKVEQLAERMMEDGPEGVSQEDMDRRQDRVYAKLTDEDKEREARNNKIIVSLGEIAAKHAHNTASGYLDQPFRLRITRNGAEFNELVTPRTASPSEDFYYRAKSPLELSSKERKGLERRLKDWHNNAEVSGYGDVREQVTKVDRHVRQAKEIPASEFTVEPELLARIADLWDQNFFPNSSIRVEPYKIHLYGPGDHFSVHRDTPQSDLVGTFLLGLGDTTEEGGLVVDGKEHPAYEGRWCAFYPDVPHLVKKVAGYRAAIAFKVFRTSDTDSEETTISSQVRKQVSQLIGTMEAPFGILLQRKYCLGTTKFSGFDAVLLHSARALPDVEVRQLPIILESSANWGATDGFYGDNGFEMECKTAVYPFTKGHVDALVEYVEYCTDKPRSHVACGAPWLEGVRGVPFFSLDLDQSLFTYHQEDNDTCAYVGNETQMCREDSIYLSYALLVLPKGDQRPGQSQADSDASASGSESDSEFKLEAASKSESEPESDF